MTEAEWSCCFLGTHHLVGGFNFRTLSPLLVEMMQFDEYVSNGLKVENNKYTVIYLVIITATSH